MAERMHISGRSLLIKRTLMTGLLFFMAIYARSNPLVFNILDYKAKGDGITLNTKSIQAAIDACSKSGGGTVWFPAGRFVSGTIYLKSHVTIYLDAGAVLTGSKNLHDYPVTVSKIRSYTDNYTDKSLIYGEDLEQIAITGQGTIDGNGASFEINGPYKNRPYLIRIINCRKVQVLNVSIINSPMWVQHYLACNDVTIIGITVNSRVNNNNDGIDIDGCENVRISDCNIISGDDAIVLKSTMGKSCRSVTITNCILSSYSNAFKLGTETNGAFQDIVFSNCTIYDTHMAAITLQLVDGGILERVNISNVTINGAGAAIFIRLGNRAREYEENGQKPGMGSMSHVSIENVQGYNIGKTGCSITGLPGFRTDDIKLSNISLAFSGGGTAEDAGKMVPELPAEYPEYGMFGDLPSYGFYCRHCINMRFENISLGFDKAEARPAMVFEDVENLQLTGIKAKTDNAAPVIQFSSVKNAIILSSTAYDGTGTFLQLKGMENLHLTMTGNDLSYVKTPVTGDNRSSVFLEGNRMPPLYGETDGHFVNCGLQYTDDREIKIHSPAEIKSKRKAIINAIWGTNMLPDRSDVQVTSGIKSPLSPNTSLSRVDRYEIPVNAPVTEGAAPVMDLAYLFVPVKRSNRLVMLNPGHTCTLKDEPESNYRIEATINGLLKAGFDVLAVFMPHVSETGCNLDHCSVMNTGLTPGDHPATYGLRFFLEPEIVSLNYLLLHNNYKDINMVGLSGGGWTTNLLSAIDDRIKLSFSVAGSMPLYYRSGGSMGDIEQFLPELYRDIAGYPDLYVLGAYGKGRRQVQILNRKDDCCFGQNQHDPDRNYDSDLKTFEASVKEKLKGLDADGHYYLVIDETAPCHQVSGFALNKVILKELIGK
jgi:polygalacturonase